jgi:maltose alpha-D-glucosyltransferase/alpha-amylase
MGEDLALWEREAVRTPMQWDGGTNAGFSAADAKTLVRPPIAKGPYGYAKVNVASQQGDPDSALEWMRELIALRRGSPMLGLATCKKHHTGNDAVLGHEMQHDARRLVCFHNLSGDPKETVIDLELLSGQSVDEVFSDGSKYPRIAEGHHRFTMPAYGYRWLRVRP